MSTISPCGSPCSGLTVSASFVDQDAALVLLAEELLFGMRGDPARNLALGSLHLVLHGTGALSRMALIFGI